MRFSTLALTLGAASSAAARHFDYTSAAARAASKRAIDRQPDDAWDHVVKGEDLDSATISSSSSGSQLSNYKLRAKPVDPSELGVDDVKQYAGYLDNDQTDKHLFYWFFESRNDPKQDPVILWLNGGPGCSSLVGLFQELGPAKILPDQTVKHNPYSWNSNASVIFVDQPVNVGYSYTDNNSTGTTTGAADDLYGLLSLFFHEFPEYADQDFHVAGESYAGHYVPGLGHKIVSEPKSNINLKSILVGNGLTDPFTQYEYYRPMACGDGGYPAVLSPETCKSMDEALPECRNKIKKCYDGEKEPCIDAFSTCNANLMDPYQSSGRSVYDIRANYTEPASGVDKWLNSAKVKKALGVEVDGFEECSNSVYSDFEESGDWMKPIQRLVPDILAKVPVLVYAGDADFICNWLGNRAWTHALEWPGKEAFNGAKVQGLSMDGGDDYANLTTAQNFAFAQVFKAGHMVPQAQPEGALDMVNRWVNGEWWEKKQ